MQVMKTILGCGYYHYKHYQTIVCWVWMLLHDCYSPLTICPRAIVEVSSFSTDNVKTPTWRQILEVIILTAGFSLSSILLLHRHQTCTHKGKHISFSPSTLPIYLLYTSLWHLLLSVSVWVCVCVCTRTCAYRVHPGNSKCQHHWTASPQNLLPSAWVV